MNGFINGYYTFAVWLTRFLYLNILWVAFTFVGLIVFGLVPSTVAMFAVVRKWVQKEDVSIWEVFWKSYKKEFVKANILGIIFFVIGYLLIVEFQILRAQEAAQYFIASYFVIALFVLYFMVLTYFFPIFVHFQLRLREYLKWPFIIGISHPLLTVFLLVGVSILHYVMYLTVPALLFFIGGSVTAYIIMWGVSLTFAKYEN